MPRMLKPQLLGKGGHLWTFVFANSAGWKRDVLVTYDDLNIEYHRIMKTDFCLPLNHFRGPLSATVPSNSPAATGPAQQEAPCPATGKEATVHAPSGGAPWLQHASATHAGSAVLHEPSIAIYAILFKSTCLYIGPYFWLNCDIPPTG